MLKGPIPPCFFCVGLLLLLLLFRVAPSSAHRRVFLAYAVGVPSGLCVDSASLCRLRGIVKKSKDDTNVSRQEEFKKEFKNEVDTFVKSIKKHFKEIEEASAELKQQAVTGVIGIEASKDCWKELHKRKQKKSSSPVKQQAGAEAGKDG